MGEHVPIAFHHVAVSGAHLICPQCGTETHRLYTLPINDGEVPVCGRCYDDNAFTDKPELRAEIDRQKAEILKWVLGHGGR